MRVPDDTQERISALLYSIHATTRDEAAWADALGHLRHWFDSRWTTLAVHHAQTGQGSILHQAPDDPDLSDCYAQNATRNPWFLSSQEYATGTVLAGEDLLNNRELVRTDFYRVFLQPHRLLHRLCGVAARRGGLIYYVALHRGDGQPGFSDTDRHDLRVALSHLSLALENRWQSRQAQDFARVMAQIVDHASVATFLVDAQARLLFQNRMADDLLQADACVRVVDGRLAAACPVDERALQQAIRAGATDPAGPPSVLSVSVPGGGRPAVLTVQPAGPAFTAASGEPLGVAVVTARHQQMQHTHCAFARQHQFTPAQTRLSALLFAGHTLADAARLLRVSDNTVRSHLKQIFQKTDTHSQMELVHLHARICVDMDAAYLRAPSSHPFG